jgi:hypothetical protein
MHIELFGKGKAILNSNADHSPAWFCAYARAHLAAWMGIILALTTQIESLHINVEHEDADFFLEIVFGTKDIDWTAVREEEGLDVTFSHRGVN